VGSTGLVAQVCQLISARGLMFCRWWHRPVASERGWARFRHHEGGAASEKNRWVRFWERAGGGGPLRLLLEGGVKVHRLSLARHHPQFGSAAGPQYSHPFSLLSLFPTCTTEMTFTQWPYGTSTQHLPLPASECSC
jgi:hypothetical protein